MYYMFYSSCNSWKFFECSSDQCLILLILQYVFQLNNCFHARVSVQCVWLSSSVWPSICLFALQGIRNGSTVVMLYAIWYHLYNLGNVENAHGGVRLKPAILLKLSLLHECFSHFLNCTNDIKLPRASQFFFLFFFCTKSESHKVRKVTETGFWKYKYTNNLTNNTFYKKCMENLICELESGNL